MRIIRGAEWAACVEFRLSPQSTSPLHAASQWTCLGARLPLLANRPKPALPIADAGFFFPRAPYLTSTRRALKAFSLNLPGQGPVRRPVVKARGLWLLLSSAVARGRRPWARGYLGVGLMLRGPNMALSLRRAAYGSRLIQPSRHSHSHLYRTPSRRASMAEEHHEEAPLPTPVLGLTTTTSRLRLRRRRRNDRTRASYQAHFSAVAPGLPRLEPRLYAAPRLAPPQRPKGGAGGARTIMQVKYRPGLSRAWRLLRTHFCMAWDLPWHRQRRLTNFISQLRGVTGLGFLQMCMGGLGALIKESGLGSAAGLALGAWVNGRLVRNPFFQVYMGDRIIPGVKGGGRGRTMLWANQLRTAPLGAWEVDGLTRTITIVAEPSVRLRPQTARPIPFLTFRMYNWKYRH